MEFKDKNLYEAPSAMIVEVKTQRIICTSEPEGHGHGYDGWQES